MRQQVERDKTITGYVADEPKVVNATRGQMVVFPLAEPQQRFNRETQGYEDLDPIYYDVAVGRAQLGQNVLASVQKGQRVSVTGNHSVEAYVDREGKPGIGNRLWAEDVSASMQHNTVEVRPGVTAPGADQERSLGQRSPESVSASQTWQASHAPVEQHFAVQQGGPEFSGPAR